MLKEYKTFETERLQIKPTLVEDAAFILDLLNTPKWMQYIGDRNVHTVEDAKAYIRERMLPQLEKLGYSNYTVTRKSDGEKLGTCGLYNRDGIEGIDIGFAFLPQFEKKVMLLKVYKNCWKWLFMTLRLKRLVQLPQKRIVHLKNY